jgi:hypothetical protein
VAGARGPAVRDLHAVPSADTPSLAAGAPLPTLDRRFVNNTPGNRSDVLVRCAEGRYVTGSGNSRWFPSSARTLRSTSVRRMLCQVGNRTGQPPTTAGYSFAPPDGVFVWLRGVRVTRDARQATTISVLVGDGVLLDIVGRTRLPCFHACASATIVCFRARSRIPRTLLLSHHDCVDCGRPRDQVAEDPNDRDEHNE